jgi:hypothetical protein
MSKPEGFTSLEWDQLRSIGHYADTRHPYWWGEKTMPKLAARGLVEPHKDKPKAWQITEAGREVISRFRAETDPEPKIEAGKNG